MIISERTKQFKVDLLRCSFVLIDSQKDYDFLMEANEIDQGTLPDYNGNNGSCSVLSVDGSIYFVMAMRSKDTQILIHEVVHLVHFIFDHLGIPVTVENSEIIAYTTDYIYGKLAKHYGIPKKYRKRK